MLCCTSEGNGIFMPTLKENKDGILWLKTVSYHTGLKLKFGSPKILKENLQCALESILFQLSLVNVLSNFY